MSQSSGLVSRRTALQGAIGLVSTAAFSRGQAQVAGGENPADAAKSATVWRDMSRTELDTAYDQGPWAPNLDSVWARYEVNSNRTRERLGTPRRLRYGKTAVEAMDLYPAAAAKAAIQVFVHGGAWYMGTADVHGFLAGTFVGAGAHFIALDFTNVGETGGKLEPMAKQVRNALAWIHEHADEFGGDADRLFVSGHSSGGHLAGVALTTDWNAEYGLPANLVKGGVCVSGIFDLLPVSLSFRREYVDFTADTIEALSPQRHIDKLAAPLIVAYGTLESPEFQRQSRDFAAAVDRAGKPVELIAAEHYNHFEILETLANPYGLLGHAALTQMELD